MPSEREKMAAGDWYRCLDPELDALRATARDAVFQHNHMAPDQRGMMAGALRDVLGAAPDDAMIEAPFHCAYGCNIFLGPSVYLNTGCVFLDCARIEIGARSLLGPGVQIYCADHHHDPVLRGQGLERALPVTLGRDVWIGGNAILLPGVSIGDGAIVGAGSVVARDVVAGATVVGNPGRVR